MIRLWKQFDKGLKPYWKNYVFQSLSATAIMIVLLGFLTFKNIIIISSIGSSVFIVFAMPGTITAHPRHLIFGQIMGLISGIVGSLLTNIDFLPVIVCYAFAVGLSVFLMVITDTEHPPAAGTALGVAVMGFSIEASLLLIYAVSVLAFVRTVFRNKLRDLL